MLGEECPLYQVHEVRADVVESLALLRGVEEPWWSDVRSARDDLLQVMDTLHVDRGLFRGAPHDLPERRRIVHERALETVGDLEALRHDVVSDDPSRVRLAQRRRQEGQIV